ncbi:MAG: acyl-CoA reductase [Bacteroidia bacterium]|nr:acyl-CoA reductase [Bacteroidia bacterium]MBT8274679.1 acyl-CoA reductase [Bacteroidia bacterium]NNJ82166.1 acyl-CoA reductase [Flavobacteriaceae bacterium]NNM09197.1 acyl-CoA reductase [Flavobacteriaceae bacterium]
MQLQQRINAFIELGKFMSSEAAGMDEVIVSASMHNSWFTNDNISFALKSWSQSLSEINLKKWLATCEVPQKGPKTVAIVMAGNIPLVGFHDFLSVLITGNNVLAKLSSNDTILLPFLAKKLIELEPGFADRIEFTEERLSHFDAVIATGSNNTARYFDYYFGKYPNIIRRNRNSVAVLTGTETPSQLKALADDIFRYFGLGCRNVSKIFLPKEYNFDPFFNAMFSWKDIINNNKYINNYDYNKAVYLMSDIPLLDNEFMLLKEDTAFSSPISVVFYEYYNSLDTLADYLSENKEHVQAIISDAELPGAIPFGQAQSPRLWDYADGVDTVSFLLALK